MEGAGDVFVCVVQHSQFQMVRHTDNTSPAPCIRTHHITAVHATPQTLNNINFLYFTIIHSYPILFSIIFQK